MKYYKITFLYKGHKQEVVLKSLNKAEAIIDGKKTNKGLLVKIEEVPMPFEEKIKWATLNGAKALNIDKQFGSLTVGKKPGINLIKNFDLKNLELRDDSFVIKIV